MTRTVYVERDGRLANVDDEADVLAVVDEGNPLSVDWKLPSTDVPRVVCWSGTLGEELFESDPRTWLRPGREAFASFCERIEPDLEKADRRLCFRPHARHVLSDTQSCLNFTREHESDRFEVALAVADLFEPSMLVHAEDHLFRMFEAIGDRCAMVMLSDALLSLPQDAILAMLDRFVPATTPIVLNDADVSEQRRLVDEFATIRGHD